MIPVANILPPHHTHLPQQCASVADVAAPLQMICHIFLLIFNYLCLCCRGAGGFYIKSRKFLLMFLKFVLMNLSLDTDL